MTAPLEVVIVHTQFTPGLDPMIIEFCAKDVNHPLLGKPRQITPTQREVAGAAADADLATVSWTDAEIEDTLIAQLALWGIDAVVVPNVQPVPVGVTQEESIVQPVEEPPP